MVKTGVVMIVVAGALAAAGAANAWSGLANEGLPGSATTVAPSTTSVTSGVTTLVPLPAPAGESVDPVRTLVPWIVAIPEVLTTTEDRLAAIGQALADPSNAIAVVDGPGTLCAIVPIAASLMADGRWERNGEPIASSGDARRDPPGYGDCLPNDDGTPFRDGIYQYVAVGPTGARSAAATVVIGVGTVGVWFLNNGDEPVCMLHASPTQADFYEAFATNSPLQPGEAMRIRVADVDQDLRVFGCPPDDALRTTRFSPRPRTYVALFETPDTPETTGPPPPANAPVTTPPTTAAPTGAAATTTTTA